MAIFDVVFEGGGAKGTAFVGALTALAERGHATRRLIGTSAGAITASLVAAGYSPAELLAVVTEKLDGKPRFASFMDHPHADCFTEEVKRNSETMRALAAVHMPMFAGRELLNLLLNSPIYPQLFSFIECGGLFAGDEFVAWLTQKLKDKGVAEGTTMADFFHQKQVDLSVVTSDTTEGEMLVLNHRTAPDVPVALAVRMSMSIPFIWREMVWQPAWGLYRGRAKDGNIMVDGGVLSNFPIRLISDSVPEIMGDTDPNAALNLGLLLDEQMGVPGIGSAAAGLPIEQLRVVQRVSRVIDTMMGAQDNDQIREHAAEICRLPVQGCGTTEFNMDDRKRDALIAAAHSAVVAHLDARHLAQAAMHGGAA